MSVKVLSVIAGSTNLKRPGSNQSSTDEAKRIKTYQCEACDKWFTSSGHLKRHFNTTLHKNATRHQHKSGGSPRIGTPSTTPAAVPGVPGVIPPGVNDLGGDPSGVPPNSISNLNTPTSTLNSSPSPSSPHPAPPSLSSVASNNNVPSSPRPAFYNSSSSRNSSPMTPHPPGTPMGSNVGVPSPAKIPMMMNMLPNMRPLPSMKESMSHIKEGSEWGSNPGTGLGSGGPPGGGANQQQIIQQRGYDLYSPDSVSAVNR